jgi:hypothetical protein
MLFPTRVAQEDALNALSDIRATIDRSTRYSTFSALSGFIAGGAALCGSGIGGLFPQFIGARPEAGYAFVAVWGAVLAVAAVSMLVLTALKARQRGEAVWTPIARTAFNALIGPGVAGVAGSAVLISTQRWELLPGLWLLMYGCGLWGVSFFAPTFLRALGAAFIALGLLAWLQPHFSALCLGAGFGGLHMVFGGVVMARYRK